MCWMVGSGGWMDSRYVCLVEPKQKQTQKQLYEWGHCL